VTDPLVVPTPERLARRGGSTSERPRATRAPLWLVVVSAVVAVTLAAPLLYLVVRTVELGGDALDVLRSDDAWRPLVNTLLLASGVAPACAAIGTLCAWLVSRTDLPCRAVFRVVFVLPLVIPSFVGAFAFVSAFAPGGLLDDALGLGAPSLRIEGYWGAFAVLTLLSYPYVYLPVLGRFANLPPELEEMARSLGRSPLEVFRTVVLPQSWGAVGAGTLLVFLYVVSDFGAVSLMRYDALTRRIDATRLLDPTVSITLSMLLGAVALVIVWAERRFSRRRATVEVAPVGRRTFQAPLGRWRAPAFVAVSLLVVVALVAPVAVLATWAWRGMSGTGRFTGPAVSIGEITTPLTNTVVISIVAAVVTVALVLPLAYLTQRHRSRVAGSLDSLVVAGFALPGLVIALALVFWVLSSSLLRPLYQTYTLLVFAYAVHFGAQAIRGSQVAVDGVPPRVGDAAQALGAARVRRFLTVDMPLMRSGLAAAMGLVLLSCMKELPATLLLAPTGFETLATRIWGAAENGFLARAGLASLVLILASALLTWLLTIRRMGRLDA
jgi:iron(III) transport system permease protein